MIMKYYLIAIIALLFLPGASLFAQPDTINAADHKLLVNDLHEGKNVYLVYFTDSLFKRKGSGDIWERSVHFEKRNGQDVVNFYWEWLRGDSLLGTITNICDRKTLAPIFHKAEYKKRGIYSYDFRENEMIADDTVANNQAQKNASVKLNIPVISWEEDLETYPLLPIKKIGQQFDIAFFDPNEKAPSYHRYE